MGELRRQTSEIAADIQSLSHELHAAKLQYLGIAAAMRGFCQEFGEQQKAKIDFQTHDLASPLSPDISLSFFQLPREGLHTTWRHSTARHTASLLWPPATSRALPLKAAGPVCAS